MKQLNDSILLDGIWFDVTYYPSDYQEADYGKDIPPYYHPASIVKVELEGNDLTDLLSEETFNRLNEQLNKYED